MKQALEFATSTVLIGIGATIVLDLWSLLLKHTIRLPSLDYGLLGRWVGHLSHGRWRHEKITNAAPVRGELALGWIAHYAIGVIFAGIFLAAIGLDWMRQPTPLPALFFGIVTVAAPFFILQPGMGIGVAASKMPKPGVMRLRSLTTHAIFGIGLYLAALLSNPLIHS